MEDKNSIFGSLGNFNPKEKAKMKENIKNEHESNKVGLTQSVVIESNGLTIRKKTTKKVVSFRVAKTILDVAEDIVNKINSDNKNVNKSEVYSEIFRLGLKSVLEYK